VEHPKSTRSCESCGNGTGRNTRLVAYRAIESSSGPWLVERLCRRCRDWYRALGHWNLKPVYPLKQMTLPSIRKGR